MATSPIFVGTAKSPAARATVANTNRDGATGTYVTLFTAGASGSFFKGFEWQSEEDVTAANAIRLFVQDAGAGNVELIYEAIVAATTFAVGVTPAVRGEWYPPGGLVLTAGSVVKISIHATDTISGRLTGGGDY